MSNCISGRLREVARVVAIGADKRDTYAGTLQARRILERGAAPGSGQSTPRATQRM